MFYTLNTINTAVLYMPQRLNLSSGLYGEEPCADKSCHRPCKLNAKPQRCQYDFEIKPTLSEDGRPSLTVNNITPGPPIHVCLNDIIVVRVKNQIPNQQLAIHWHGIEQRGTPYMDGVPMITQCPIMYGSVYQYSFIASTPGTFFYHANSVNHHSDGVYGSLIVHQPKATEHHASLYDFDKSLEHTLVIGTKFPILLSGNLDDLSQIKPEELIINGQKSNYKLFVNSGYAYRIRLINAIAVECSVNVGIHGHLMKIIASDGKPVKKTAARVVKLYPGERMDVVVRADQRTGGYWIQVAGEQSCEGLQSHALFLYSGFNYTSVLEERPHFLNHHEAVYGQQLQSLNDVAQKENVQTVYLRIDRNVPKVKVSDIDFRYISDALPKKPLYPAALSLHDGIVQINGKNFLYPNAPLLLNSEEVFPDSICNVGEEARHKDPQCIQILEPKLDEAIELVLLNEGFGSNDSYTFHMHGYSMQVLATWQSPASMALSKKEFLKLDKEGLIERNTKTPPIKDTINVPNKGYTIVRIEPDFGGHWLLECRSCGYFSLPAAVLISVPVSIPKVVIDSLPSCGSYKPADVLLN